MSKVSDRLAEPGVEEGIARAMESVSMVAGCRMEIPRAELIETLRRAGHDVPLNARIRVGIRHENTKLPDRYLWTNLTLDWETE